MDYDQFKKLAQENALLAVRIACMGKIEVEVVEEILDEARKSLKI